MSEGVGPDGLPSGELVEDQAGVFGPSEAPRPPPSSRAAWVVWALAGALGCALAGGLAAANEWTGLGPTFQLHGLPAWAWGAIRGALIGLQSGVACLLWARVRAGRTGPKAGAAWIVLVSTALLVGGSLLIDVVLAFALNDQTLFPMLGTVPLRAWSNVQFGLCLLAALLCHATQKSLAVRLFLSWLLSGGLCLPVLLGGMALYGTGPNPDFFWQTAFPYYLALPLSWWVADRFRPNPFPVIEEEEPG
ncbi:MAG: hypothetical protein JKY65_31160 [Planctomycetes bacterium]|nr:hypothetical protein [Planctomycetota bacterium]